jgi:hypothetical protein
VQFQAVGPLADPGDEPSDATVQFQAVGPLADPIMPFGVTSQPSYGPGHANGDQGQAEVRSLIHSILARLKPREREVIELSFRHDLNDNDLAIALGVSQSRAHDLAARARGRLEETLGALHIALTGREACPVLGELLADWNGRLTEHTRDLVVWHTADCQTCAHHKWGAMRPAAFSRLLPLSPLPPEPREQVLSLCSSTADAVAYRRRVARHAEWIWVTRFSQGIRQVSWDSIRANPGMAIAAVAIALWIVAAVGVTLFIFAGSRAAHAQAPQKKAATYSRSAAAVIATTPISAAARPSPTVTQPSAYVPTPGQTVSSRVATSPTPSHSTSSSPRPSKSPTPSPSRTASPSPSSSTPPA